MTYSYQKHLSLHFAEAVRKVKTVLPTEEFGVLTEIDVKATLKKKLNVDFPNYLILGICNPSLAYQALQTEKKVGLFMPCNIIIYECEGNVTVSAVLPTKAMDIINNPQLKAIAQEAEQKIKRIIDAV